jgi:energy-coupling factor transporter transmembrane protein EcfT
VVGVAPRTQFVLILLVIALVFTVIEVLVEHPYIFNVRSVVYLIVLWALTLYFVVRKYRGR